MAKARCHLGLGRENIGKYWPPPWSPPALYPKISYHGALLHFLLASLTKPFKSCPHSEVMEGCIRSVNGDVVITSVHLISSSSLFPFCLLPCLPPSWPLTGLAATSRGCHRLVISPGPAAPSAGKSWLQAGQSVPIITPKSSSPGEHIEKTGFNAAQCLKCGSKDCRGVQALGVCLHSALGQGGKMVQSISALHLPPSLRPSSAADASPCGAEHHTSRFVVQRGGCKGFWTQPRSFLPAPSQFMTSFISPVHYRALQTALSGASPEHGAS